MTKPNPGGIFAIVIRKVVKPPAYSFGRNNRGGKTMAQKEQKKGQEKSNKPKLTVKEKKEKKKEKAGKKDAKNG